MLNYIGRYVKGIKTIQAFQFLREFMPQYGYAGLKELFGRYDTDFRNGFDRQLWEEHTYSGCNVTLTLKRNFLEDDPGGQLLLLHWADEYFFTVKPNYYLAFIKTVLEDECASGLLPRDTLRKLFDLLLTQHKLSVYEAERLKERYFSPAELQADKEAKDAEQLAKKREEQNAEIRAMREDYADMADGTFQSTWKFIEQYHYRNSKMALAAQIVHDGLDAQVQAAGSTLVRLDAAYFLYVCARLIQYGTMDWTEAQSCISKFKEVLDDAPGNDTDS